MPNPDKQLVVVDANSLLFRCYHALPTLNTPDGIPMGGAYGFMMTLLKILGRIKPLFVAVAWDLPAPTFRHLEYVGYKAKRPPTPADFFVQQQKVQEMLQTAGIAQYSLAGYEADDVIGTIATKATRGAVDLQVVIVTGDFDALQLVNDRVRVFTPVKNFANGAFFGIKEVKARYQGLMPSQIVDYKSLKGDPSDNIPGVKGIGDKTAITLLLKYHDLDGVFKHLGEIGERQRELLVSGEQEAYLSRKLAQIVCSAPLSFTLAAMVMPTTLQQLAPLFQELGFRTLLNKIGTPPQTPPDIVDGFDVRLARYLLTGDTGRQLTLSLSNISQNLRLDIEKPANKKIHDLYYQVEIPIKKILISMHQHGITIDQSLLEELKEKFKVEIKHLQKEIFAITGFEFNLNSPKQLQEVLFDQLKLPSFKKTKTQRSTDESVLNRLIGLHPVVEKLLHFRQIFKISSTYLEPLGSWVRWAIIRSSI